MVVFTSTDFSFHGHPDPLTCPPERSRRSLALYYYSNGRPTEENGAVRSTFSEKDPKKIVLDHQRSPEKSNTWLAPPIVLRGIRILERNVDVLLGTKIAVFNAQTPCNGFRGSLAHHIVLFENTPTFGSDILPLYRSIALIQSKRFGSKRTVCSRRCKKWHYRRLSISRLSISRNVPNEYSYENCSENVFYLLQPSLLASGVKRGRWLAIDPNIFCVKVHRPLLQPNDCIYCCVQLLDCANASLEKGRVGSANSVSVKITKCVYRSEPTCGW